MDIEYHNRESPRRLPKTKRWALYDIDSKRFVHIGAVDEIQERFAASTNGYTVARFRHGKWRFLSKAKEAVFRTMVSTTGTVVTYGQMELWK